MSPFMKKHLPAALALLLGLVGATTLMAQAPTHDIDSVTETPAVRVQEPSGAQCPPGTECLTSRPAS